MEYGRLQPLKGNSAPEPTAFTKKTIKELLAEEGADASEALMTHAPEPQTQQQPQTRSAAPGPAAAQVAQAPAEKSRSLFGRLLGR